MAIWAVFIMVGMMIHHRRERQKLIYGGAFVAFSGLYFVFAMKVVLPAFQPEGVEYQHFKYAVLGDGFGDAIKTLLTRPGYAFEMLYTNHVPEEPYLNGIKSELYLMMLLSGGLALLWKPHYLLMALPIIGQKVYSDKPGTWGINNHYSIELVPIIALAVFSVIMRIQKPKLQYAMAIGVVLLTFASTFWSFKYRETPFYRGENQNLISWGHWKQDQLNLPRVRKALDMIPDGVPVAASNPVLSHLSMRDKAYMIPRIDDAEYVLIIRDYACYPSTAEKIVVLIAELQASGEWETLMDEGRVALLKRQ